jgi:hypothetical protein
VVVDVGDTMNEVPDPLGETTEVIYPEVQVGDEYNVTDDIGSVPPSQATRSRLFWPLFI